MVAVAKSQAQLSRLPARLIGATRKPDLALQLQPCFITLHFFLLRFQYAVIYG
jgi:hypothetical protein